MMKGGGKGKGKSMPKCTPKPACEAGMTPRSTVDNKNNFFIHLYDETAS
jgi:hypothetical protein